MAAARPYLTDPFAVGLVNVKLDPGGSPPDRTQQLLVPGNGRAVIVGGQHGQRTALGLAE